MARGFKAKSDTDLEVARHLDRAAKSVRDALDTVRGGPERGYMPRRVERELRGIEAAMRQVRSVGATDPNDLDAMPEDRLADLRRQERAERRTRKEATEVTDG